MIDEMGPILRAETQKPKTDEDEFSEIRGGKETAIGNPLFPCQ